MVRGRLLASLVVVYVGAVVGGVEAAGQSIRVVLETGDSTAFGGSEWTFETPLGVTLSIDDFGRVAVPVVVRANGAAAGVGGVAVCDWNGWALRSTGESLSFAYLSNVAAGGSVIKDGVILTPDGPEYEPFPGDLVPGGDGATFVGGSTVERIGSDGTVVRLLRYQQDGVERNGVFGGYGPELRMLQVPRSVNGFGFTSNQPVVSSTGLYAFAGEWRDEAGIARRAIMLGNERLGTLAPVAIESQPLENLPEDVVLWDFGMSLSTSGVSAIGINAGGDVVFNAWLAGAGVTVDNRHAICVVRDGTPRVLIRRGDPTPSGGVVSLPSHTQVAISDSGHVLALIWDRNESDALVSVLWRIDPDGTIRELVRHGGLVPGRSDGAVWPQWSGGFTGFSMNQRGDVLVQTPDNQVVFETGEIVRNVWAMGRSYLAADGRIVRAIPGPRSQLVNGGGNDGLGRRINAYGAVCVVSAPQPWVGPSRVLVIEPPDSPCDSIDFNYDASLFDPADVDAFFSVYSEGPCVPAYAICGDADFNNDGATDPEDIDSFLSVFGEGPCER